MAAETAGEWVTANTEEDSRFAMKDSGSFSTHSRRDTTNLDGLIMNAEYQQVLCSGLLHQYLLDIGVKYFVAHNTHEFAFTNYEVATFPVVCRLDSGSDSVITVRQEDEFYRGLPYFDGTTSTRLIIWNLSPPP